MESGLKKLGEKTAQLLGGLLYMNTAFIRNSRRFAKNIPGLVIVCGVLWLVAGPDAQRSPVIAVSAQAPSSFCFANTSTPPQFGTIARKIAPTSQSFISDYAALSQAAWCTFLALNWKAAGTGSPTMSADASAKLGTCANQGDAGCLLVWETWRRSDEVYSANPLPCSSGSPEQATHLLRAVNPNSAQMNPHAPGQLMRAPLIRRGEQKKTVGSTRALGFPNANAQATGFILPDKNNSATNQSVILYEARENPSACTTITTPIAVPGTSTKAALNTADQQMALYNAAAGANLLPQPPAGFIQFQGTAFEVKPSWYQFQSGDPTPQQLGMVSATGTNGSSTYTIGLTGFHIIWKVFPKSNWFWATFEYAGKNQWTQPYISKNQPANSYFTPVLANSVTLYQPSGTYCNAPPCSTDNASKVCTCPGFGPFTAPSPVPCASGSGQTNPAPCDPVGSEAAAANTLFQQMLAGTPFANYQLVGVQVAPTLNGASTLLANNHIETDFGSTMANTGGNSNPTSSCITCHYLASIGNCPKGQQAISRAGIFAGFGGSGYEPGWGHAGDFPSSQYKSGDVSYLSSDFVWSVQEAPWASGNSCPSTSAASITHKAKK
jgi:hypothetical protein